MTAPCREACCTPSLPSPASGGGIGRGTVSELFERGCRRSREAPLSVEGETCAGADDNTVSFSLDVASGKIAALRFRATCCATLIAYCEYIAEIASGFRIEIARELSAQNLIEALPGVPALKRDRAVLAIAGFRSALLAAQDSQPGETNDEGRLHFRHAAP